MFLKSLKMSLYTLYISKDRIGTIIDKGDNVIYISTDSPDGERIDLQLVNQVVDEALRNLSFSKYIITTNRYVYYGNNVYNSITALPIKYQYMALPIIADSDITTYKIQKPEDNVFIDNRCVIELKDAVYILIPPNIYNYPDNNDITDLLITYKDKDEYISFNDRQTKNLDIAKIDGKYIYLKSNPVFTGTSNGILVTYTMESLRKKCISLNKMLEEYGIGKVKSMYVSLLSSADRLKDSKSPFKMASVYDTVVNLMNSIRSIE